MTPSLCTTIETTAMVYLDDELAATERRELELHLLDCSACRDHVDRERAELASLRVGLARVSQVGPAPDLLRARLRRELDAVDASAELVPAVIADDDAPESWLARVRRIWLPTTAALVAAAAIALFALLPPTAPGSDDTVAHEAVRQQRQGAPLEVQGASTAPWLDRHFRPGVRLPAFADDHVRLLGARLTALAGRPAAQLFYALTQRGVSHDLVAFVVDGVPAGRLDVGRRVDVGGRRLYAASVYGTATVTYVDAARRGYVFTSPDLSVEELRAVVIDSNLIDHAGDRVR